MTVQGGIEPAARAVQSRVDTLCSGQKRRGARSAAELNLRRFLGLTAVFEAVAFPLGQPTKVAPEGIEPTCAESKAAILAVR